MNPHAFQILEGLGLATPRTYSLDDAVVLPSETRFYLRYHKTSNRQNDVQTSAQIRERFAALAADIASGNLLKIEKTYHFAIGGATLVKTRFSYTEFVSGHLCALLRNGLCGARVLIRQAQPVFSCQVFQGWEATQGTGTTYVWSPTRGLGEVEFAETINLLATALPQTHPGLLLEWFIAEDGLLFCDARIDGFDRFGNALSHLAIDAIPLVLQPCRSDALHYRVDELSVDLLPHPADNHMLIICNGALLSHYITRHHSVGIGIQLGVNT